MDFDEFSGGGAPVSTSGPGDPQGLPDMDSLFEHAVSMDDVRQTQADALKPAGSYVTIPDLSAQASRVAEGPNKGRLLFRLFGQATLTVTERNTQALKLAPGTVVKGGFGFAISPERANKIREGTDTGEPDNASKLWAMAVAAYQVVYKQKPNSWGDVVRYLQGIPTVIRVIQVGVATDRNPEPDGEPGNVIMAISPVREARG